MVCVCVLPQFKQRLAMSRVCEDVQEMKPSSLLVGMESGAATWKMVWRLHKKSNIHLAYEPSILLLDVSPRRKGFHLHQILENETDLIGSDRKQSSLEMGWGRVRGRIHWGLQDWGSAGHVHCLDCGNSFTDVKLNNTSKLISKLYPLNLCGLLYGNYISMKVKNILKNESACLIFQAAKSKEV